MSYQENEFPIVLERFAVNYPKQQRAAFELLPIYEAETARDSYKIAKFEPSHLEYEDFRRAYGEAAVRTQNQIQEWTSVYMSRYTIESSVDRAELVGAVDAVKSSLLLREARLKNAYDKLMNAIEADQFKSISDASKYGSNVADLEGGDVWDGESSNPIAQIEAARKAVKDSCGVYPNKCVISDPVWQVLRTKENLLEKLPSTSLQSGLTPEDFAKIISVDKVIIADNMYHLEGELRYTWGSHVVLAYVPEKIYSLEDMCFGLTVRAPLGYSNMRDYFDDRTTSDVTAIDERLGWAVVNYQAGFLFRNVLGG